MSQTVSFCYEMREQDVITALAVIDRRRKEGNRKYLHTLGLVVVAWMFVPELLKDPGRIINWVMVALAVAVGVLVWTGEGMQNRRFARSLVQSRPTVEVQADETGLVLKSADGITTYRYDDTVNVYDYQDVLAIDGGRGNISVIPKNQSDEETITRLTALLKQQLPDRFETVQQLARR